MSRITPQLGLLVVTAGVWVSGTVFSARTFGFGYGATIAVLLAVPLVVAWSFVRRFGLVSRRELAYLVVLGCVTTFAAWALIFGWQAYGYDDAYKWEKFEHRVRQNPKFEFVAIRRGDPKRPWSVVSVEGTVRSDADLTELRGLAAEEELMPSFEFINHLRIAAD